MRRLALTSLALLAGCASPKSPAEVHRALCGDVAPDALERCLDDLATEAKTLEACAKLPPSERRAGCEKRLAIEAKDPEQCERVVFLEARDTCLVTVADAKDDPAVCAQVTLPRPRRHCYVALARKRKDPALCAKIPTAFEREQCVARAAPDESACATVKHPRVKARCLGVPSATPKVPMPEPAP